MATEKRLIDVDKLEKMVTNHRADYLFKEDVLASIAKQPTVDAVEVVHGYWKETAYVGVSRCSCCDKPSSTPDCLHEFHDYCPNCGAKMDGGDAGGGRA